MILPSTGARSNSIPATNRAVCATGGGRLPSQSFLLPTNVRELGPNQPAGLASDHTPALNQMPLQTFIERIRAGGRVSFQETLSTISTHYDYTPTRFSNGEVVNEAGSNEGSCRLFYFAKLNGLTESETLALFGDYYWRDVLDNPQGEDHANIRAFMRRGWTGIAYEGEALHPKQP